MPPRIKNRKVKGFLLAETLMGSIISIFLIITAFMVISWVASRFYDSTESYKHREKRYEQLEIRVMGSDLQE